MVDGDHGDRCICSVCTCGRHKKCKPAMQNPAPISGDTEYKKQYPGHAAGPRVLGKPTAQQLAVGGDFSADTESRSQYGAKQGHFEIAHKAEPYMPSQAPLENVTSQRNDYRSWPVSPVHKPARPGWAGSAGPLETETTSHGAYQNRGMPPRFVRPAQAYQTSGAPMEDQTTARTDYGHWKIGARPAGRHAPAYASAADERDFASTTRANYVAHDAGQSYYRPRQERALPPSVRFEGESTVTAAYKPWAIPPRFQRERAGYQPSRDPLEGQTTYGANYVSKTVDRYIRPPASYEAPATTFEGESTHHHDYVAKGAPQRRGNFAPQYRYNAGQDDRDFATCTKTAHDSKPMPVCPAAEWAPFEHERHPDGHVFLHTPLTATAPGR